MDIDRLKTPGINPYKTLISMEIVPWIENIDFKRIWNWKREERLKYRDIDVHRNFAEIDRIDRGQMDNYYKMRNCHVKTSSQVKKILRTEVMTTLKLWWKILLSQEWEKK